MALQSDIKIWKNCEEYITFNDVYIRVMWVKTDKENAECNVWTWSTREESKEGKDPITNETFTFTYNLESGDNVFVQAYNFLKTVYIDHVNV